MEHSTNCSNQGPSPTPRRVEPGYPDRDRLGKGRLWAHRMGMGKVQARAPRRMYFGMSLEGYLHERRAGVLTGAVRLHSVFTEAYT